jgi:molecular chaperone DnaK
MRRLGYPLASTIRTNPNPSSTPQRAQAVALGAAVQAGILEGEVSGVMVMDVWQASLMRALAVQLEREQKAGQGEEEEEEEDGGVSGDEGEDGWGGGAETEE